MKSRIRKVANFFAFNLLFFALYLNFIYKDNSGAVAQETTAVSPSSVATTKGTVAVENPAQYLPAATVTGAAAK
ncbi:MAG TPA: hypothetical protein PKC69_00685 [Chitinophagaceae bacterium]|nr:hypothetical protein [Chitinophagaceae bacterium]